MTESPMPDHEERHRRAHIAEIAATPDWLQFGSGQRAETIPDGYFAERKAHYTRDGGRSAPWSVGDAAAIGDRIRATGTVAHDAYYGISPDPDPRDRLSPQEREAIAERVRRRRSSR